MRKLMPTIVFLTVSVLGIAGAVFVWTANERTERIRFHAGVDQAVDQIEARFGRQVMMLDATSAFLGATGADATASRFRSFADALSRDWTYPGLIALGFAALLPADTGALEGAARPVAGREGDWQAPVVLRGAAPGAGAAPLGRDMFAEDAYRQAMEQAAQDGLRHAARAQRSSGGTGQEEPFFLVFAPIRAPLPGTRASAGPEGPLTGFAFAAFRVADLFSGTILAPPTLPLHIVAHEEDALGSEPVFLSEHQPSAKEAGVLETTRNLDLAGRHWLLTFRSADGFEPPSVQVAALLLGALALICGAALAALVRAEAREAAAAAELAEATRRNLAERELMLREMQHRIKNSITRILAIARQTAATAPDLPGFLAVFGQRLQAMASAQDMLSHSQWHSVALRAVLEGELVQAFGRAPDPGAVAGPEVQLNEKATQALGLTFHELATNAIKYHGGSGAADAVRVAWSLEGAPSGKRLVIDWTETGASGLKPPERSGFGTKLIDTSIRMELGGEVARDWRPDGVAIRIALPAERCLASAAPTPKAGEG